MRILLLTLYFTPDVGANAVIMTSGRPIIAAVDAGSDAWNLVEQSQGGLCVEPENPQALTGAIRTLYADPALRQRLGHNGRQHVVQHYTRKIVAQQYHQLLEGVVGYNLSSVKVKY